VFNILLCTGYSTYYLSLKDEELKDPILTVNDEDLEIEHDVDDTSITQVFLKVWVLCAAICIHWIASTFVSSLYGIVPSSSINSGRLIQILVYTNLFGNFIGNQLTLIRIPFIIEHPYRILIGILVRASYIIFYIIYIVVGIGYRSDILLTILNSIFSIFGGYFSATIYTSVSLTAPKGASSTATSLVNIALYIGIIVGIGSAFTLSLSGAI